LALDKLSGHALNQVVNGRDLDQQDFWNGRLEHYLGRSEIILAKAEQQRALDDRWQQHLESQGQPMKVSIVKKRRTYELPKSQKLQQA